MTPKKRAAKERKRNRQRQERKQLNVQYRAEAEQKRLEAERRAEARELRQFEALREGIEAIAPAHGWSVSLDPAPERSLAPAWPDTETTASEVVASNDAGTHPDDAPAAPEPDAEQTRAEIEERLRDKGYSVRFGPNTASLHVTGVDRPGLLAEVTRTLADHGANITQAAGTRDGPRCLLSFQLELPGKVSRHRARRR